MSMNSLNRNSVKDKNRIMICQQTVDSQTVYLKSVITRQTIEVGV